MSIIGFDVSFYQDDNGTPQQIDFQKMYNYGASFVVIKAGQWYYSDPDFAYNWKNAKLAGFPRSSYWFGDGRSSGKEQAQKYWELIRYDIGEGFCCIDYENGSWTDWNELYNFLVEFKRLSGLPSERIVIYTGYYYWYDHCPPAGEKREWFKQFPLWIAAYVSLEDLKIPEPWDVWFIWQTGTPPIGHLVGVESRDIDYNIFGGNEEEFTRYFGVGPNTSTPQEPGNDMTLYYADLKMGYSSNLRSGPGTSYAIKYTMRGPLTVSIISEKAVADGYDWYQIDSPDAGWIALTTSYENFRPANQTPVADYPVKVTIEMKSGKIYVANTLVEQ